MTSGQTINASYFIENCLKPLVCALNEQRPTSGTKNMKFHHENAKPHVAKKTIEHIESEEFKIIRYPPYSPDLAPCDFWLFDILKRHLDTSADEKSLEKQITKVLSEIPKEQYAMTFQKWLERMQLC